MQIDQFDPAGPKFKITGRQSFNFKFRTPTISFCQQATTSRKKENNNKRCSLTAAIFYKF